MPMIICDGYPTEIAARKTENEDKSEINIII
jgi:hypothetical protein